MGAATLTRPELLILAPLFMISTYLLPTYPPGRKIVTLNDTRKLLEFSIPLAAFVLLNQSINYLKFGSWFSVGYGSGFTFRVQDVITALAGNLFSPGRGIFLFFPLTILSLLGFRRLLKIDPWFCRLLTAFLLGSFLLYAFWKDWGAGLSWGPRFFIPILPYLALLAFTGLETLEKLPRPGRQILFGLLVGLGGLVVLQGLLFDFVKFYGSLSIPQHVIDRGDYNFLPENSPVLSGWGNLDDLSKYDIYWLQTGITESSKGYVFLFFLAGLFILGFLTKTWIDFFKSRDPPFSAVESGDTWH
jgi:hypothetical protein